MRNWAYRLWSWRSLPSLVVAVITGVSMGLLMLPPSGWINNWALLGKLIALLLTIALAIDARFRVIPSIKGGRGSLLDLFLHVLAVTLLSLAFTFFGWALHFGKW